MEATKLTLPVVKVIGAVIIIGSMIWFASAKNTIIETNSEAIKTIQVELRSVPTREEFSSLKTSIDKIEMAVNAIQEYLLSKPR